MKFLISESERALEIPPEKSLKDVWTNVYQK